MRILREHRDGSKRWRRFPFYYTLLALSEINEGSAIEEMRYAAPGLERMLKRRALGNRYELRRRVLAERILAIL
jgi:hypothetical protein